MIGAVLAAVPIICYYIKQGKRKQDMCDCCKSSVFIALLFFYGKGGNSSKTRQAQIDCVQEMKLRWGKYFDYNFNNNKPRINVKR